VLPSILADLSTGRISPENARDRLAGDVHLREALRILSGQRVEANSSVINFGTGNSLDTVAISGDVAGGSIFKLEVNLGVVQHVTVTGGSVGKVIGEEKNYYQTFTTAARSPQEQRNRKAMITKVRAIWIDGFLNKSLTDELRIELNLTDRPDTGALMSGLIFGMEYGCEAVFRHYTLRWFLSRNNRLPFRDHNLIPWLDFCVDRLFLRRVGGGYIFVHRMLMEHFAEKYQEPAKK
jgi:hypothetical protein